MRARARSPARPPRSRSGWVAPVAYLDADVAQKTVGPPATVGPEARPRARRPHARAARVRRRPRVRGLDEPAGPSAADGGGARSAPRPRQRARAPTSSSSTPAAMVSGHLGPAREVLQGRHARARPGRGAPARRGAGADPRGRSSASSASTSCRSPSTLAWCPRAWKSGWRSGSGRWRGTSRPTLQRFRVKPTVFMPTLPPLFDLRAARPAAGGALRRAGGFHRARLPRVRAAGRRAPADLPCGRAAESA